MIIQSNGHKLCLGTFKTFNLDNQFLHIYIFLPLPKSSYICDLLRISCGLKSCSIMQQTCPFHHICSFFGLTGVRSLFSKTKIQKTYAVDSSA